MKKINVKSVMAMAVLVGIVAMAGCIGSKEVKANLPAEATAKDIIPDDIEGYTEVNTNELASKAAATAVGAGVATTGDVNAAYTSAKITDSFIKCYQDAGAVDSGGYYREDNPLYGGAIVAVDKNQITDPNLLFRCIKKSLPTFSIYKEEFQPCSSRFTIKTDYNEFYVVYAATDTTVCDTFCDNLPACLNS